MFIRYIFRVSLNCGAFFIIGYDTFMIQKYGKIKLEVLYDKNINCRR